MRAWSVVVGISQARWAPRPEGARAARRRARRPRDARTAAAPPRRWPTVFHLREGRLTHGVLTASGGTWRSASWGRRPSTRPVGTQFFQYFVYGDSVWSLVDYDLARAGRDGATVAAVVARPRTPTCRPSVRAAASSCWRTAGPIRRSARAPRSSTSGRWQRRTPRPRRSHGCS